MSGVVLRKREEMAASQSGGDTVEFERERSFEPMDRHDHDAPEARIRSSASQTQWRPLSRLQKQAPAKIQLKRPSPDKMGLSCRSPIPLLSPLLESPSGGRGFDRLLFTVESPSGGRGFDRLLFTEEAGKQNPEEEESVVNAVIPMNGWQHPAAPFFAERICSFSHCFADLSTQDRSLL